MTNIRQEVGEIKKNARRLAQLYQASLKEKKALLEENLRLQAALEEHEKKLGELENKNLHLHVSETLRGVGSDKNALKKKLDKLIKEIDACIEQLNG